MNSLFILGSSSPLAQAFAESVFSNGFNSNNVFFFSSNDRYINLDGAIIHSKHISFLPKYISNAIIVSFAPVISVSDILKNIQLVNVKLLVISSTSIFSKCNSNYLDSHYYSHFLIGEHKLLAETFPKCQNLKLHILRPSILTNYGVPISMKKHFKISIMPAYGTRRPLDIHTFAKYILDTILSVQNEAILITNVEGEHSIPLERLIYGKEININRQLYHFLDFFFDVLVIILTPFSFIPSLAKLLGLISRRNTNISSHSLGYTAVPIAHSSKSIRL